MHVVEETKPTLIREPSSLPAALYASFFLVLAMWKILHTEHTHTHTHTMNRISIHI